MARISPKEMYAVVGFCPGGTGICEKKQAATGKKQSVETASLDALVHLGMFGSGVSEAVFCEGEAILGGGLRNQENPGPRTVDFRH
jgi:hypothetical protein